MQKKWISLFLCLMLLCAVCSASLSAFAADTEPLLTTEDGKITQKGEDYYLATGTYTLTKSGTVKNQVWHLADEVLLIFEEDVQVDVTIEGVDHQTDPSGMDKIIMKDGASNETMGWEDGKTYYWVNQTKEDGNRQSAWYASQSMNLQGMVSGLLSGSQGEDSEDSKEQQAAYQAASEVKSDSVEADWTAADGSYYDGVVYDATRSKQNTYDLYIPASASKTQPMGLILFIHGGAWFAGSEDDMAYACRRFARAGYITATIDYRMYDLSHLLTGSDDSAYQVSDMLDDITSCLNHIYEKCQGLGYTVNCCALSGFSAGSHLSALYSYSRPEAAKIPVVLTFNQSAPIDFHSSSWTGGMLESDLLDTLALQLATRDTAGVLLNTEQAIRSVSPVSYITEDSVPSVYLYAGQDTMIGTGHAATVQTALEQAGVDYTMISASRSDHFLELNEEEVKEYFSVSLQYCKTYLNGSGTKNAQNKAADQKATETKDSAAESAGAASSKKSGSLANTGDQTYYIIGGIGIAALIALILFSLLGKRR